MRKLLALVVTTALALSLAACRYPGNTTSPTPDAKSQDIVATQTPPSASTPTASPVPPVPPATAPATSPATVLASPTAEGSAPTGWKSYQSDEYGFELSYPPRGMLIDVQTDHARIDLPFDAGTNLQEKYLEIDASSTGGDCVSPLAMGYDPAALRTEVVTINNLDFRKQSGGEGAAGSFYEWVAYSTTEGSTCVSLTFVLHSTDPGNYETPPPLFDAHAESSVFEQVVTTFRWLP